MNASSGNLDVEGDSIDIRLVLRKLWAGRMWMAVATIVTVSVVATVAFTMTPIYRAAVVLVPTSSGRDSIGAGLSGALGQLGGLAALAGANFSGGNSTTEEALAVLRSHEFIEHLVNELRLIPELYRQEWDEKAGGWKAGLVPPTTGKTYRKFMNLLAVTQDRKTGLVTLEVEWRDRQRAADWANELIKRVNAEMRSRAIANANASLGYLEQELTGTAAIETRDAINRLIEGEIKQRMLANVSQEYSFRVVDKATAPDADDRVRPKRMVMLLVGALVGIALGSVGVLWFRRYP